MLRKEREMAKWKQTDLFDHGKTTCAECNRRIYLAEAVVKQMCTQHETMQEHFCSENCHQAWYLKRLNQKGL